MAILSLIMIISFLCTIIGIYALIITAGFGFWLKYTLISGLTFIVMIIATKIVDSIYIDDTVKD